MITRIELTNFMSHERTVIEPAAGLTVLVGPNNCGKSAVVGALQILCHNENSTYVMRHGAKECSVEVETDDGHVIRWRRKDSPSYLIDDKEYGRLRQCGLPEELHQALRLPKVEGCDAEFDVHFGTQKNPIFLLDSSAANRASFFASSSDAIRLVEMQRRHKDKVAGAKAERQALDKQSKQLNAELALLEPVVELDQRLSDVEQLYSEINEQLQAIRDRQACANAWEVQSQIYVTHCAECQALSKLQPPPLLADEPSLESLLSCLEKAQCDQSAAIARVARLAPLPAVPDQANEPELSNLIERVGQWDSAVGQAEATQGVLSGLESAPEFADDAALHDLLRRLDSARSESTEAQGRQYALAALSPLPELNDAASLAACIADLIVAHREAEKQAAFASCLAELGPTSAAVEIRELTNLVEQLGSLQRSVDDLRGSLAVAEREIVAMEQELKTRAQGSHCPACGGPLDPQRVLAQALLPAGGDIHGCL